MCLLFLAISAMFTDEDVINGDVFGQGLAFGTFYTLSLRASTVEKAPKWHEGDNPPLSAKSAIRVAEKAIKQLEVRDKRWSESWTRHVSEIALVVAGEDRWYWVVHFYWVPTRIGFNGQAPQLSVAVTLDGQAILPTIVKDQKPIVPGSEQHKSP